ncbi:MAG: hypothetical protein DRP83_01065 [Planctomycetota bacterium]|nr:MAG: hypothetical protein DRP83_01065 [Planctomycetota bacterium]
MSKFCKVVLALAVLVIFPALACGAGDDAPAKADGESSVVQEAQPARGVSLGRGLTVLGACFGAGVAAIGGSIGVGRIGSSCIDAMARQPEAAGAMFAPMIVTAAMVEGGMLFAIVVCLLSVLSV